MSFDVIKKWTFRILSTTMLVLWMIIIFRYSAQPAEESSDLSGHASYNIISQVNTTFAMGWNEAERLEKAERIEYPLRKAAHMTEYAIFAVFSFVVLWTYGMSNRKGDRSTRWHYVLSVVITFLYACTDEYHQTFVPGRAGKFTDVCIDTSGAIIAMFVVWGILILKAKKLNNPKK